MEKWYKSSHHRTISIIEVSSITFIVSTILFFVLQYLILDVAMDYFLSEHKSIILILLIVSILLAAFVTTFVVSGGLYKVKFSSEGITVKTKMYGNKFLDVPYSRIQFIQLYSEKSTVRNKPKAVIVLDENSKYELMLHEDKESTYITSIAPAELIVKVM